MKIQAYFLLLSFSILTASSKILASSCGDGRNEAMEVAEETWDVDFSGDCDNVLEFEKFCKKELIEDQYNDEKYDNYKEKAFKKCARDGIRRVIKKKLEECLDPEECDEYGKIAAELVINDFCRVKRYAMKMSNVKKECRDEAKAACRGYLFTVLKEFLDDGLSCEKIDDDIDNFRKHKKDLRRMCGRTVKKMIH